MNKYTSSLVGIVFATAATAADLPSKSLPQAPSVPASSDTSDFYAGASIGSKATTSVSPWSNALHANVRGGWEFSEFARVEADYDYAYNKNSTLRTHTFTTNAIGQYKVGFIPVVPYALVGVGYRWADVKNEPVYVAGAGVRYDIASNIEIDGRYRYITDRKRVRDENVLTLGVNYKF